MPCHFAFYFLLRCPILSRSLHLHDPQLLVLYHDASPLLLLFRPSCLYFFPAGEVGAMSRDECNETTHVLPALLLDAGMLTVDSEAGHDEHGPCAVCYSAILQRNAV